MAFEKRLEERHTLYKARGFACKVYEFSSDKYQLKADYFTNIPVSSEPKWVFHEISKSEAGWF